MDTQIINFNDVKKNFPFESLFSFLTDSLTVEKNGLKAFNIPFKDSPKILISTNYAITGTGESYKGRMFEVEFSDYYNSERTPIKEMGKIFFENWNSEEWDSFNTFMMNCTQYYLTNGLVTYKKINIERKKLELITSPEFCAFADGIPFGKEFDEFINKYPIFPYRQRTFNVKGHQNQPARATKTCHLF